MCYYNKNKNALLEIFIFSLFPRVVIINLKVPDSKDCADDGQMKILKAGNYASSTKI